MIRIMPTWRPAPRRVRLAQEQPEPITDHDITRYRVTSATTGLVTTAISGASAWAGIYMGRKASGIASVVGWGIGILSGLGGLAELALSIRRTVASPETITDWIETDRAVAEAWAKSVMR